ncbi:hypothetical protein JOC76_001893 [Neobacillus cucumis]|nr:hypothetical protein [Neobacillus cucumis]
MGNHENRPHAYPPVGKGAGLLSEKNSVNIADG